MADPLSLVAELQDKLEMLRSIREAEQEIGGWSQSLPSLRQKREHPSENTQVSSPCKAEGSSLNERRGWRQLHTWGGRQTPSLSTLPSMCLCAKSKRLWMWRGSHWRMWMTVHLHVSPRSGRPMPCITAMFRRKKKRIIVIDDSLLRGTEGPICQAAPSHREVCCPPRAQVKDISRKRPSLVLLPVTDLPYRWRGSCNP